jgi:hypothetical protein
MGCKYIVVAVKGVEHIFTFPKSVIHKNKMDAIGSIKVGMPWVREYRSAVVVSAGFISNGICHGRSESLGVCSRGDEDTALLKASLGLV